jgi:eukaryotic-like serine/threonine-protein kinase
MQQPFGKYVLLDRIAIGGMAEIFLARQTGMEGFEKTVVLKRIRPQLAEKKSFVKMFLNEAKLAAQLSHHNIVQILDLGRASGSYFIAMEYLHGRDLRRVVPKAESQGIRFPIVYACKIASQVLEGLYYAHQKTDAAGQPLGIVHRDVTPENIFVTFDGGVKVLDFGIAKAANIVEQTGEHAGEIKGKLSYMSPEQCAGRPLDHRSDLFSLGVVLYEWVTGFKLFTGESDVAILKAITEGRIYQPSYFKADVPEPVEAILMKALEKDPDQRYQSAWEMQYELDRFLVGNEFTPSNNHLATFIRQLFKAEIDEERSRLLGSGVLPSAVGGGRFDALDVEALASGAVSSGPRQVEVPPKNSAPQPLEATAPPPLEATSLPPLEATSPQRRRPGTLAIELLAEEEARLEAVAAKVGLSPEELAREMLRGHLKYHS